MKIDFPKWQGWILLQETCLIDEASEGEQLRIVVALVNELVKIYEGAVK